LTLSVKLIANRQV